MRLAALVLALTTIGCSTKAVKLVAGGTDQKLRDRPDGAPQASPAPPPILVLALDGVSRDLLYQMLRAGELPRMTELLGGDGLAHAYLDDSFLSTMPSTTMDAWVAAMTGRPPADTGVAGNEYFIREKRQFACPAPISF
ncbi:MAG TPA: alkaline phosphatase family protein, partial [Kofleriaceae bacterium]|nr:alkaline phosphatase family protein [Kofleriaceae bacterium]